jgi:hypothetical protein
VRGDNGPVDRHDLRDIGDRILWQSGGGRVEQNITWGLCQLEIAGERHTNGRREATAVKSIALDDDDGTSKSRTRTDGLRKIGPAHVTLTDYHSESRRIRLDAADRNSSGRVSTWSEMRFIASVIESES